MYFWSVDKIHETELVLADVEGINLTHRTRGNKIGDKGE